MSGIKKSPWVSFYNAGGCNGCTLECVACFTPKFDVERLGIVLKSSAKHADVLLVTGIINKRTKQRLLNVYNQLPKPKKVVAVGACAVSGGVFKGSHAQAGPLDKVIPVDIFIPGCPPRPESIMDAILKVLKDD